MKDKNSDLLPKRGNPLNETVTHKIGGTFYEISTVCGGGGLLYDKMTGKRKSDIITVATWLSGVHYRRNEHMTTTNYPDNITALYAHLSQENALDGESNSIANHSRTVFETILRV